MVTNNTADDREKELEDLEAKAVQETQELLNNDKGESTPGSESAPDDKKPTSDEESTPPEDSRPKVEEEDLTDEETQQLSVKAQRRIKRLVEERNAARDELTKLKPSKPASTTDEGDEPESEQVFDPGTGKQPTKPAGDNKGKKLPWDTTTDEEENGERSMTQEELDAMVEAKAKQTVESTLKQREYDRAVQESTKKLHSEISEIETKYPELNPQADKEGKPTNPDFDPKLVNKISGLYKVAFRDAWGKGKYLSFSRFVDSLMSLRKSGEEKGKSEVTAKVVRQAAEQALGPSGTPAKKGSIEDKIKTAKTIEELEALEQDIPIA